VKISSILALTLAGGTLFAQSPGLELDARFQIFGEISRPVSITVFQGPDIQDEPLRQTGLGARFMGEIPGAPHVYYELGGKGSSTSHFTYNGSIGNGNTMDLTALKVSNSYWSVGAAYLGHPVETLTLGAHLEARGEALNARGQVTTNQGVLPVYVSTTYLRPWVRLSADVTVPMLGLRPYIGLDASAAVTRTTQTQFISINLMDNRTLKSLAPNFAAALYLGIRF
jgi:hypothetical protein